MESPFPHAGQWAAGPHRTVGNLDQIGGVSLDTLLADVDTEADYAMAHSYGGYSTNLPLEDLLDGKAWVAFDYDGEKLAAEHGGPARLLVPHLYFWEIGQVGSRH